MPAVSLSPIFNGWQGLTAGGLPLAGGFINTYLAGTLTPAATYTTNAGNIDNTNPIQLGPDGRPPQEIWLIQGQAYKFVVTDSLGTDLRTFDNISGIESGLFTFVMSLASSIGATLVGWMQAGAGAILRTVQDKLRESVSVLDFGADPTGVADSAAAFNAAITYLGASGGRVIVPKGTYKILSSISISAAVWTPITIKGSAYSLIDSSGFTGVLFNDASGNVRFEDMILNGPGKAVATAYAISSALGLGWVRGCTIRNYYYGVECSGSTSGLIERNRFSLNHAGVNCVKVSPLFSNIVSVLRNYFDFNDYGVFFMETYGLVLDSNAFEFNATGASLNNVREIDLRGNNWFESNTTNGFELLGSCTGTIASQTHVVGNIYTISSTSLVCDDLTRQNVLLRLSAAQSIPHATATDIAWNVETVDPAGMHPAGASANVNIFRTGVYNIAAVVQFAAVAAPGAGVFARVTVKLNAATLREVSVTMNANEPTQLALAFPERLGNADVLQVAAYQNSGAGVNVLSGAVSSFSATFVSPD